MANLRVVINNNNDYYALTVSGTVLSVGHAKIHLTLTKLSGRGVVTTYLTDENTKHRR